MPKMSELKNSESKLAMENRDDGEMNEEMYRDESNDEPFKGAGKDEEEDAPEDLDNILSTLEKSTAAKKRKNDLDAENLINSATKGLSDSIKKQEMDRKRARMTLQRSLVSVVTQMELDSAAVKECNQQLQQMLRSQQKLALKIEASHRERIQSLRDINETYSKMCKEMDIQQRDDANQALVELAAKFKDLQQKLTVRYRRKSAEAIKNALSNFF